jgi:hypothetical protein
MPNVAGHSQDVYCINAQCRLRCTKYLLYSTQCCSILVRYLMHRCPVLPDHCASVHCCCLNEFTKLDKIQIRPWQGRGVSCESGSVAATEVLNRGRASGGIRQEAFCNSALIFTCCYFNHNLSHCWTLRPMDCTLPFQSYLLHSLPIS